MTTLSQLALNRATLARQLLLARADLSPVAAVGQLFAMQSQLARPPFIGLWSRLAGFEREALIAALHDRSVVRATSLRGTLHLMTAADFLAYRQALQPVLDQGLQAIVKARGAGLPELEKLMARSRTAFEEAPKTFEALRELLLGDHPDADERAMGYAVRMVLPLVQVPTDADWGFPGTSAFTTAESWLGRQPAAGTELQGLVMRYLASYGPASPKDMQTWSGLKGLKPVFEAMRPVLCTFRDAAGRELFDLPDAPRPPEETPAPVRFLPDFDTLVLAYDDRSRLIDDDHRARIYQQRNLRVLPTFLVDGRVAGTWSLTRKATATLAIQPFDAPAKGTREALLAEGERLVRFAEPGAKQYAVTLG